METQISSAPFCIGSLPHDATNELISYLDIFSVVNLISTYKQLYESAQVQLKDGFENAKQIQQNARNGINGLLNTKISNTALSRPNKKYFESEMISKTENSLMGIYCLDSKKMHNILYVCANDFSDTAEQEAIVNFTNALSLAILPMQFDMLRDLKSAGEMTSDGIKALCVAIKKLEVPALYVLAPTTLTDKLTKLLFKNLPANNFVFIKIKGGFGNEGGQTILNRMPNLLIQNNYGFVHFESNKVTGEVSQLLHNETGYRGDCNFDRRGVVHYRPSQQ